MLRKLFIPVLFVVVLFISLGASLKLPPIVRLEKIIDNDSVFDIVKTHKSICFNTGNPGFLWTIVYQDDAGYRFITGFTDKDIEPCNNLDTLSITKNNKETLSWGFDSLAILGKEMHYTDDYPYSHFYNELYVVENGEVQFHKPPLTGDFNGPNEERFNERMSNLMYLMFYLAIDSPKSFKAPNDTISSQFRLN